MDAYPHPVDDDFMRRLEFIARWLSVMWLTLSYERGRELEKCLAGVENAHGRVASAQ